MPKLYIFGIGGTGSRVLRSLTMLLASGVRLSNGISDIVPVIIDPDRQNGDLTRTVSLLNNYMAIQDQLSFTDKNHSAFFRTRIIPTLQNFILPIRDTDDRKFRSFLDLPSMSKENQAMMRMLFSEKNLESSMNVGFKGNPNVGSVVLNQVADSDEFAELANTFQEGDRIFVISSIFGGTGAAGFPLLVKTLRTNNSIPNFNLINNAEIGAVTVLPYFKVKQDEDSEIDSSSFISKAKSALAYYEKNIINNNDVDALYTLGDEQKCTYENHEGMAAQINDAHLIEFLAATAIFDFTSKAINHSIGNTQNMEFGINQAGGALTLDSFYNKTKNNICKPMTQLLLMANTFTHSSDYITSSNLNANQKLGLNEDFYRSTFASSIEEFLYAYQQWLGEMKRNNRSLDIFNLDCGDKPFEVLTGKKPKHKISFKSDYALLYSFLNDASTKVTSSSKEDRLLELYYLATLKILNDKLNF